MLAVLNTLPVTQPKEVKPPHAPDNICILAFVVPRLAPVPDNVIVGQADCATNVYQTSAPAVPQVVATAGAEISALFNVPPTEEQVIEEVKVMALPQRSLAGACADTCLPNKKTISIINTLYPVTEKGTYVFID
jgi:hypothetical protein